jgi:hypothetical protein
MEKKKKTARLAYSARNSKLDNQKLKPRALKWFNIVGCTRCDQGDSGEPLEFLFSRERKK